MIDLEPLVNKTVSFKFLGSELRLDLSHALFSSFDVDQGTRLLLKAVARDPRLAGARRILDAGCGTGVIGLAIAKAFPEAEVVMRDRDTLAVAFAEHNRLVNKLRGRTAWDGSDGGAPRTAVPAPRAEFGLLADGLETAAGPEGRGGPFDFVLSNLPAKAGAPVLAAFFARAAAGFLAPSGRLAVVIVNPLAEKALEWIAAAGLSLVSTERGTGHTVYIADRAAPPAASPIAEPEPRPAIRPSGAELDLSGLSLAPYARGEAAFKYADATYRAMGYWGLPDFDTVGYVTALAAEAAARALPGSLVRDVLVIEPGIGHFPLWLARKLGPARIASASRDLLALAATGANLAVAGGRKPPAYRCLDALRLDELAEDHAFDLIAEFPELVPGYDWIGPAWDRAGRLVKTGGAYLVSCPTYELARMEKRRPSGWRLKAERRRRGFAATAWIREGS